MENKQNNGSNQNSNSSSSKSVSSAPMSAGAAGTPAPGNSASAMDSETNREQASAKSSGASGNSASGQSGQGSAGGSSASSEKKSSGRSNSKTPSSSQESGQQDQQQDEQNKGGQQKSWLNQQQWLKNVNVNQLPQQLKDFGSKAAEQVNKMSPTQKVVGGALLVSGLSWLALRSKSSASKGEAYRAYRGGANAESTPSSKWNSDDSVYRGTHTRNDDDNSSSM